MYFKGCPLRCVWCHNPESQSFTPEVCFHEKKCIGCGACVSVCPAGAHEMESGKHVIRRALCLRCGRCAGVCPAAITMTGRKMTVEEVLQEVEKDRAYFETSGGGLTVTGGEPMAQFSFLLELAQESQRRGISVCMETCGFAPTEHYEKIAPYVDCFLFDCKETDDVRHKQYTGVDRQLILENLKRLSDGGSKIILRCPLIPGFNDREAHLKALGELASTHAGVIQVDVEPYHSLGRGKKESYGYPQETENIATPSETQVESWIRMIAEHTAVPVKRA